jgi:small subunit ribosomal protein S9
MVKKKIIHTVGKKKRAIARLTVLPGEGKIIINNKDWKVYFNSPYYIQHAEDILNFGRSKLKKYDMIVNIHGGGIMGQLQAFETALGKAIIQLDPDIKPELEKFNRNAIVDDVRRVEPKKDRRRKARAKFQKSYR